jgi:hypothetical protein
MEAIIADEHADCIVFLGDYLISSTTRPSMRRERPCGSPSAFLIPGGRISLGIMMRATFGPSLVRTEYSELNKYSLPNTVLAPLCGTGRLTPRGLIYEAIRLPQQTNWFNREGKIS